VHRARLDREPDKQGNRAHEQLGHDTDRAHELGRVRDWVVIYFERDGEERIVPVGGTECLLIPGTTTYNTVPAGTPGAITDSLGNTCLSVTSRTFYQNTPGTIYGVELEATARPTDGLTLQGIFGYTHWKSSDINDNPLVVVDLPIYVPELNWNVSASSPAGAATPSGCWSPWSCSPTSWRPPTPPPWSASCRASP
jgi:hypothetical protein